MTLPFSLPFTLPDWLPTWAFLLLALPVLLYLLVFLVMPFSVFGVKSRLESLERQLDDIQDELRHIANRNLGRPARPLDDDPYEIPNFSRMKSTRAAEPPPQPSYKPIPPAPLTPLASPRDTPRLPQRPPRRTEPRLD
jgi:hypothetical protein